MISGVADVRPFGTILYLDVNLLLVFIHGMDIQRDSPSRCESITHLPLTLDAFDLHLSAQDDL